MSRINAAVTIHLDWSDADNEWAVEPGDLAGNLGWATMPQPSAVEDDYHVGALDRASNHPVTAEDLAHMLGSALAQTVREHNKYVEHRPASPALIGMLKDKISESVGMKLLPIDVASIVQAILPVVSSVDQNAHLRGRAEALTEVESRG